MGPIRVRPWEGKVYEVGLEPLALDVNNNLEAPDESTGSRGDAKRGVHAVTQLLRGRG